MESMQSSGEARIRRVSRPVKRVGEQSELSTTVNRCAQILWNSQKRGVVATPVISAYSSQEGSVCHFTDRKNRPDQRTFRCQVCGFEDHADHNAAVNLSRRIGDRALRACRDRKAIKAVLMQRHEAWKQQQGMGNTHLARRRKRGTPSAVSST
jgi:hypothetical protein